MGVWLAKERGQKKRDYVGKIPEGGEGSDPNPLHIFLCFFSNSGAYKMAKKTVKKCENSQTGGRGSATWRYLPHNPVFFCPLILLIFCPMTTDKIHFQAELEQAFPGRS